MRSTVIILACLLAFPALAQVEPRVLPGSFPTNAGDGGAGIFPVPSGPGVKVSGGPSLNGNEVRGPVTFNLNWHVQYSDGVLNTVDQSLTVIYTIDGVPISDALTGKQRITSPYTLTWDSKSVPDGSHVVAVIIVDGTWNGTPYNGYVPTGTHLIVDNVPGPILGPQKLASLGTGEARYYQRTALPEWITWDTGYTLPHPATTVPYVSPFSPPAYSRGLPDGGLALNFIAEPLNGSDVSVESTVLRVARTKTGHIFIDNNIVVGPNNAVDALPHAMAQPLMDGPRNDNALSGYATYIPWTPTSFWGIELSGRMTALKADGSVITVAGRRINRDIVPYTANDPTITEADRVALGQIQIVGTFDKLWNGPLDLALDPRSSHKVVFVADTGNGRVTKTTFATGVPITVTHASGFLAPSSVIIDADGAVYVADYKANTISKIAPDDGSTITLLATIPNQPFTIRFDSNGNIIVLTLIDNELLRLDPKTGVVTSIYKTGCSAGWTWLEVDAQGGVGPVDDMIVACQKQQFYGWLVSADGSRVTATRTPLGHYPWAVSINGSKMITQGFGDSAPTVWRLPGVGDPDAAQADRYVVNQLWPIYDGIASNVSIWGATAYRENGLVVSPFPFGAHPSQAALRGYSGLSPLFGVQSFDEIALLPYDQIGAWITGGIGGSSPRPEIVGRSLQLAIQQLLQRSAAYPTPLSPVLPPGPTNTTPPAISDVVVTLIDDITAKIGWKTDVPTQGNVRFGSDPKMLFRWSPITALGTSHEATLAELPDPPATVHFMVVAMDNTPLFTGTVDKTFSTGVAPPPVPTASLTASPASILAGASATLTWGSTNVTACPGTGFPGGGPSGSAVVKPAATTVYAVDCTGLGGTAHAAATVTVTTPPPPLFPAIGSKMKLTVPVGVYATPSETGKKLCTQNKGATGTVMGGPSGTIWMQINYASGCDGWSIYQTMSAP